MSYQDILIRESATLPEYMKRELLDFLLFLKQKEKRALLLEGNAEVKKKPKFGCGDIKIKIAPDFDAPLDDFKDYMK